ncbi:MAG: hypothetical protein KAH32_01745 [Chlamydiia bacterium]|nr:hypothetical protein [Chlamydiia bacterium]
MINSNDELSISDEITELIERLFIMYKEEIKSNDESNQLRREDSELIKIVADMSFHEYYTMEMMSQLTSGPRKELYFRAKKITDYYHNYIV